VWFLCRQSPCHRLRGRLVAVFRVFNRLDAGEWEKSCTFAAVKIIRSRILPFKGFTAINVLGVIFVHPGVYLSNEMVNHERIHTAQQREMLFVPFYLFYLVEWLVRLPMRGNAYRNISFEREAYTHQRDLGYLEKRRLYAWRHYLRRPVRKSRSPRPITPPAGAPRV